MRQRSLEKKEIEQLIQLNHHDRQINRGPAQWRVSGTIAGERELIAIYDHPHGADGGAARIVSAWAR